MVYFLDAAHCLHNAIAGYGWIKRGATVELLTNSGRNRLNILGAYSPDRGDLISLSGTASCDAELVQQLLVGLRAAHPGEVPLLVILDNVRYQHAASVKQRAEQLGIELLYLPPYSPNLNLIERFWKFLKKKVLRNRYYARFEQFVAAIEQFLGNVSAYASELKSLMTENFHLFSASR